MVVIVTCKKVLGTNKNEGARVATHLSHYKSMGILPDAQGQLTPQSMIGSVRISN